MRDAPARTAGRDAAAPGAGQGAGQGARGRREMLAAGVALACQLGPGPTLAQAAGAPRPADASPRSGMRLTFDYVPARDGLALLRGGPTQAGYAANAASHPALIWQPRFSTETSAKGGGNAPNGEYQFYPDPEHRWSNGFTPFSLVGGVLRIRAERTRALGFLKGEIPDDPHTRAPYTLVSGILNSKHRFSQQGGYFEIDAKLPKGRATWPAFWLLPVNERHPPEIDVVEYLGHELTKYRGTVFSVGPTEHASTFDAGVDLSADFHKFGVLWTDTAVSFYLDGVRTASKTISDKHGFGQKFYLLLNLAIGSRKAEWVPAPDAATPDPADMLVRSVRAWQRPGPSGIALSSSAVSEAARVGAKVAALSCSSLDPAGPVAFTLLSDPDRKFRIVGGDLLTRAAFDFMAKQYHDVTIQVADGRGRTWRQLFAVAVLDAGAGRNQLAPGSERSLTHDAWMKDGIFVTGGQPGAGEDGGAGDGAAELLAEGAATAFHAVEQLIHKAAAPRRYIVSADLKPRGREWVKFEISRNYGKNVQVFFNLRTGEIGDQFASADDAPFVLHDCRAVSIGSGFHRCQVDLTTDAGTTLRTAFKIVMSGSDHALHQGDPARGVLLRSPVRVVEVG